MIETRSQDRTQGVRYSRRHTCRHNVKTKVAADSTFETLSHSCEDGRGAWSSIKATCASVHQMRGSAGRRNRLEGESGGFGLIGCAGSKPEKCNTVGLYCSVASTAAAIAWERGDGRERDLPEEGGLSGEYPTKPEGTFFCILPSFTGVTLTRREKARKPASAVRAKADLHSVVDPHVCRRGSCGCVTVGACDGSGAPVTGRVAESVEPRDCMRGEA